MEVRLASIKKAWARVGGDDTWLVLKTSARDLSDFAEAAAEMNELIEEGEFAEAPSHAPGGFAVLLTHCADWDGVREWTGEFARRLEQRGIAGSLTASSGPKPRDWWTSGRPPEPTAFVVYDADLAAMTADPARTSNWHVPAEATARIAAAADRWARLPGAELQLRQNIFTTVVQTEDAGPPLARSLLATGMAGVDFVDDVNRRATHVSFTPSGVALFQDVVDVPLVEVQAFPPRYEDASQTRHGWRSAIDHLRHALMMLPAETQQGCIRPSVAGSLDIDSMSRPHPLPSVASYRPRYAPHLLDRYVADANGIQVLRSAHLERTRDLSAWDVSGLGAGLFLVEARDLAPWYERRLSDSAVMEQARADFGEAILDEDVIAANPPPWE